MLIPNCLFRSNGSAVLLSNRPCDARKAKYSIRHLVRTNLAADDVAFNCVMQTEDAEGKVRRQGEGAMVAARALSRACRRGERRRTREEGGGDRRAHPRASGLRPTRRVLLTPLLPATRRLVCA
jgi:hypothetical protein